MKFRRQENQRGCGLACVAMICDVPYKAVRKEFIEQNGEPEYDYSPIRGSTTKRYGTTSTDLHLLFAANDVKSNQKLLSFKGWDKLPDICILSVNHRKELMGGTKRSMWHWVVYDGINEVVYDPYIYNDKSRSNIRKDYKRMRPKYYLRVHT